MPDHVHMLISVPPKYSVAEVIGYLKGKSSIWIAQNVERKLRILGDAKHFPFNPPLVSKKITITIKEPIAAKKMGEVTLPRRTERRQCQ